MTHGMEPQARWTAEEDATLVRRVGEGASATQIGIELCRSRNAVCGRIHRKKLQPRHNDNKRAARAAKVRRSRTSFSPKDDQVIREMAAAGKSSSEIGQAMGRHKASVVKRARAIGAVLDRKGGPKPGAVNPLTIKAKKTFLHAGNIAGKKESRANDPVFNHVTPVVAVAPLMVALVDLKPRHCKFPIGDPREEGFGFCGLDRADGAYCRSHARLCYTAPEMRRKAA
jgi:GcrA cell cycle regulator